ncbi:MAG: rRNA maturation RNase YbeY [Pseudomonadota bacterium]
MTRIEDQRWSVLPVSSMLPAIEGSLAAETHDPRLSREATLLFTSDSEVRALNAAWREKDKSTNVLSFPAEPLPGLPEAAQPLGDIALAFETCAREADEKGISLKDHATHLIVHGVLHLLGYDHISEEEAEAMEALERKVLAGLGIADPY